MPRKTGDLNMYCSYPCDQWANSICWWRPWHIFESSRTSPKWTLWWDCFFYIKLVLIFKNIHWFYKLFNTKKVPAIYCHNYFPHHYKERKLGDLMFTNMTRMVIHAFLHFSCIFTDLLFLHFQFKCKRQDAFGLL